jgi:hypothetical protein
MKCIFCKTEEPRADRKVAAVLCSTCVSKLASPPAGMKVAIPASTDATTPTPAKKPRAPRGSKPKVVKESQGFGRGWHLKKHFVAPDGTTYSFGQKV